MALIGSLPVTVWHGMLTQAVFGYQLYEQGGVDGYGVVFGGRKVGVSKGCVENVVRARSWHHVSAGSVSRGQVTGESCPWAILTEEKVREIRERYATGNHTQQALATEFGVHIMTINAVVNRKRWKHVQ